MRVTVLYGGPSAEREVSLVSGRSVIDGLKKVGHDVFASDIIPDDLTALDRPCDVVFPVLHGQWGESGELQEILEQRNLAFVGSGSAASRLGMDKIATKRAWEKAGLPTPAYKVVTDLEKLPAVPSSCVVKAHNSGSSLDVFVCKAPAELPVEAAHAIDLVVRKYGQALVEQFIEGMEITVGLLEESPLSPIRIVAKREFFDYEAKYKSNETEHRFNTGLPDETIEKIKQLAKKANQIVGARDLARVDMMVDQSHNPWLLEINTLPGFTPRSLLPEAAGHDGVSFEQLVDRLVKRAFARGAKKLRKTG